MDVSELHAKVAQLYGQAAELLGAIQNLACPHNAQLWEVANIVQQAQKDAKHLMQQENRFRQTSENIPVLRY